MEKPKIIIFTTAHFPFIGGAEIAIQEITKRLKDRFDFYIITSRFRRDLLKKEIRPEGTIIRMGFGTRLDKWLLPFAPLYYRGRTSIVVGVDISQGSLAAAVYKFFHPRTKFIFNIQYGYGEERLKKGRWGMLAIAFRFILGQADYVTAISNHLSDLARKYGYKGPIEIIPNGVDLEKFKVKNLKSKVKNEDSKIIITTSRLVPKNGVDVLIKAIAETKKEIPDVQCWIIGDGPEKESYKLQVTSLKSEENIKFFGEISHDQIPSYLHQADIFVRSSRSEGMGNSFVEALAAGLPIIGTSVGGIKDIIKDRETGLFVKIDDPIDLAEKIILLLMNKELAINILENGRKMVEEKFSWEEISKCYERIFAEAMDTNKLNILITTPLYPPDLGGPALYAQNLEREFKLLGHKVKVISFGNYLSWPSGIRHLFYFFRLLRTRDVDIVLSLDYFSVGLPAAFFCLLFKKPLILRVEGDFLWERYVESRRTDITLQDFYTHRSKLNFTEKLIWVICGWVLEKADVLVFSSEWRQKMIIGAYKIPPKKTVIIHNVFPLSGSPTHRQRGNIILWAGRMLYLKNLHRLIRAFANINVSSYELQIVGEGPERKNLEHLVKEYQAGNRIKFFPAISHKELMKKLALSTVVVLPSLSDVGPNVVAEAIGTCVPVIMTKESGYTEIFHDNVVLIDPLYETDLRGKLEKFIKEPAERTVPKIGFSRSWTAAAKDWLNLFKAKI